MPLTSKGEEIKAAMVKEYGAEKGEEVFYASKNAGKISGVDSDERADASASFVAAKAKLREVGMKITNNKEWEEYVVDFEDASKRGGKYGSSYHTDDLDDALKTGLRMAEKARADSSALPAWQNRIDACAAAVDGLTKRFDAICKADDAAREGHVYQEAPYTFYVRFKGGEKAGPFSSSEKAHKYLAKEQTGNNKVDAEEKKPINGDYGTKYNKEAVEKAIQNNRTGKIGGKEAKAIHALLKGRHG